MASTQTPGITVTPRGERILDKRHHGVRIGLRLGHLSQEEAECRLRSEMARVDLDLATRQSVRTEFADCALRYLAQCGNHRSLEAIRIHVKLLIAHIGRLQPHQIHDATLAPFIAARRQAGVSATSINRSLEIVRTVLNRAARSYRDDEGRPWLEGMPPLLTMLPESRRSPYPITWQEQDRLFRKLPAYLARMALFAVNTGLRESNVCGLQWQWEVAVPQIGRSVFVVPLDSYKSKRSHVVILNDVAWSIVNAQRGKHPIWVFPLGSERLSRMNGTTWRKARVECKLPLVRVHDLRHTFACRLRAAGVSVEDRCALLGHASHTMAGYYASADVGRLLRSANLILNRQETRTVLRVANG